MPLFPVRCSLLLCLVLLVAGPAGAAQSVDMVFTNGRIYTMDPERPWADTLAVSSGRIIYVGSAEAAGSYLSGAAKRVDLGGRMLLPGFQDVHIHPVSGGLAYTGCPLFGAASMDEILAGVSRCAKAQPEADYIRGTGWSWDAFTKGQKPHRKLLDAIEPIRPLVIGDSDGHTLWLNSAALTLAGISAASEDPPGGEIGREPGGREPNGLLLEGPAMELINAVLPAITDAQREAGLRYAQDYLHGLGVTAIQDAYVRLAGNEADRSLDTYRRLDQRGELDLRVVAALYWEPGEGLDQIAALESAREKYTGGRVNAGSVKFWADGIVESYTARMLTPYSDRPDDLGLLMVPLEEMMAAVPLLDAKGFQVHIHAIGDATVRYALDAFEAARKRNGPRDSRHLTAHTQLVNPTDVGRFAELDAIAGFSPYWFYADDYIAVINPPQLGAQRMQQMYPVRSILDSGARVAFGSDWSVTSADPLLGIESAVTRVEPDGEPTPVFLPDQRISLHQAIAAYTIDAAYANFLDADTGSLEVGKYADLVVLSHDLFARPPAEISEARVVATLVEGKLVFGEL